MERAGDDSLTRIIMTIDNQKPSDVGECMVRITKLKEKVKPWPREARDEIMEGIETSEKEIIEILSGTPNKETFTLAKTTLEGLEWEVQSIESGMQESN